MRTNFTPTQLTDPHLAEAERPRPFPRVLLPLHPIDLFERKEAPRDVEPDLLAFARMLSSQMSGWWVAICQMLPDGSLTVPRRSP